MKIVAVGYDYTERSPAAPIVAQWKWSKEARIHRVANEPRLQFTFERSEVYPEEPRLTLGRFWAYYEIADTEHKRFLEMVRRITGKLATNVFDVIDEKTGRTIYPRMQREIWAGRHAMNWCRADPRRRILSWLRPPD